MTLPRDYDAWRSAPPDDEGYMFTDYHADDRYEPRRDDDAPGLGLILALCIVGAVGSLTLVWGMVP